MNQTIKIEVIVATRVTTTAVPGVIFSFLLCIYIYLWIDKDRSVGVTVL